MTSPQFPLPNLPLELREKIWEESITLARSSTPPGPTPIDITTRLAQVQEFGTGYTAKLYTFLSPSTTAISTACRESRDVVSRLQRRLSPDEEYASAQSEVSVVVMTEFHWLGKGTTPQAAVDFIQSSDEPLVLGLDKINTTEALEVERLLATVLAARDYQVKLLCHAERQSFVIPDGAGETPATRDWLPAESKERTRLVSVYDKRAWRELKGIAEAAGLEWELVEAMVDEGGERRKQVVGGVVEVVEELWEKENEKRKKEGREGLKALPKMDVCVKIEISQGGPMSMVFGYGSIDVEVKDDMEELGIL